jgi:hypothetical protein
MLIKAGPCKTHVMQFRTPPFEASNLSPGYIVFMATFLPVESIAGIGAQSLIQISAISGIERH